MKSEDASCGVMIEKCPRAGASDADPGAMVERPVIHFSSGKTVYVESFEHGRLLSQGWACDGQMPQPAAADALRDHPADSFGLVIDGQDLKRAWEWESFEQASDAESVIRLAHCGRAVKVAVHTSCDGAGVLVRWLTIENAGEKPVSITAAAAWSGLLFGDLDPPDLAEAESQFELGRYLFNGWSTNGRFAWEPLPYGGVRLGASRAMSGYGPPFFALRAVNSGQTFLGQISWSKNWLLELSHDPFCARRCISFRGGPAGTPPLRVLGPGEMTKTPRMHLGFFDGDFDACVQAMHTHLRRLARWRERCGPHPPLVYNTGSKRRCDMTEPTLLREADKAADVGAEVFVIDAGWFDAGQGKYTAYCGDHRPGCTLPEGLGAVERRVHDLGMKFGLWIDIDNVGNRSRIVSEHPDWVCRIEGRSYFANIVEEAHPGFFMDLDLANPEVIAWLETELDRIVADYRLDHLRLDGGPTSYEGGYRDTDGYRENLLWRHCEGLYEVLDGLRRRHPDLTIDNAMGGGTRLDASMVSRSEWAWVSDDYHTSVLMVRSLNGTTLAMPPELCTRTFGTILKDTTDWDFSLRVPLFGQYTISGLRDEWLAEGAERFDKLKRHVEIYKDFLRPFVGACRVFHHTPVLAGPGRCPWCVWEYVAEDLSRALVGVFRLEDAAGDEYHFVPRGLGHRRRYSVRLESAGREFTESGEVLAGSGIQVHLTGNSDSELILFGPA